jgi:hypothetical protein
MKRIGIDFDNTIACYDGVFFKAAREKNLIPEDLPSHKGAVRDFLRANKQEDLWTELQGYIYGSRMDLAKPFLGVAEFLQYSKRNGFKLYVISHKTQFPFLGPEYDLHESASGWLKNQPFYHLFDSIFFEITLEKKIERIHSQECDFFIDDLPELLIENSFSSTINRILFDPSNSSIDNHNYTRFNSWEQIHAYFERNS